MKRPPVCRICRRTPHTKECQAIKLREQDRYTADILEKWGKVMCKRWTEIRAIVERFDVPMPSDFKIEKCAILEYGGSGTFYIYVQVQGRWLTVKEAVESPFFDKSTLPAIRHAVTSTLDEYDKKIKEAQALLKGLKVKATIPKRPSAPPDGNILAEFGADIMFYGPALKENKNDGFIKTDFGYIPIYNVRDGGVLNETTTLRRRAP